MSAFLAYRTVGEGRYREDFGLDFEQFEAGQRFKHRPGLTLSQQDNRDEALDTLNQAMLHFDAVYAGATEWKRPLVVSTLTLQALIGMTSKTFAKKARIVGFDDVAMRHPVFGGDTLYAESEVLATADDPEQPDLGRVTVRTEGVNQAGAVVCTAIYTALVYRAGRSPLAGLGY